MRRIRIPLIILLPFLLASCNYPGVGSTGTNDRTPAAGPAATSASTQEVPPPTLKPSPSPTYALPAGFKDYIDPATGITISVPESWWITGEVAGDFAILQSYHPDKYVGGQTFQPGDTKCDLNIMGEGKTPEVIVQEWTADGTTEVLSREEAALSGGGSAIRLELQSMGTSRAQVAQVRGQTVALICFGELEPFTSIADTLR